MKRGSLFFAVLVYGAGTLLFPARSSAEPSASDKETARTLLLEGRARMEAKDYAAAREKFRVAHDIMQVPTTGLDLARAEEALRLLVEARSTALAVTRLAPQPDSEAYVNARAAADELAEKLLPRIPSLLITIHAPPGVTPTVTVDGSRIPPSALGLPRKVNPGDRAVVVTATGYMLETRTVTVKEGETRAIQIALKHAVQAASRRGSTLQAEQKSRDVPGWAWASGAAGIAALGGGIGFAVDLSEAKKQLYEDCPNARCKPGVTPADGDALKERWNRDVGLTGTFIGLGAVGVGAGIVGIVMASPGKQQNAKAPTAMLMPWAGPGGGGAVLVGEF